MSNAFCYNIGELLVEAKEEGACAGADCVGVLLPKEKEALLEYVSSKYMNRNTMEIVRCLIQNAMKDKRDKSIRQFASIPRRVLTGRLTPSRNLIVDVHNYEQCGVGMVASDARIMGGVAAVLRCNITDFNMDAILRLLNDTKWRISTLFNQAQEQEIASLLAIFHAYIIGTICGNPARTWSPNVAYTYGMYGSQCPKTRRRNFCVMTEKVPGLRQQQSVGAMLKCGRMTPELYLSVFYQLALTLEGMQSRQGFCHFDLHVDKVAMRPVYQQTGDGTSWSYLLYGSQHTLNNIQFFATLHDYRYSCFDRALATTGVLGSTDMFVGTCAQKMQGIVGFMVPGQDMYSFLHSTRKVVVGTLDPNNTKSFLVDPYAQENNLRILNFVEYAIKEFYQAPPTQASSNALLCKGAGLAPLLLAERVARSGIVRTILGIAKDPLQVSARGSYTPVLPKCTPLFLTDLLPNWKDVAAQPPRMLEEKDVVPLTDTLLNMIKNKQILMEFDDRPLMTIEGSVAQETLDYYNQLVFHPDGYYHGYYQNTKTFYDKTQLFLNTYYFTHQSQDKAYMQVYMENNDKVAALMRSLRQPQFMSKVAGIVRFCQTIEGIETANKRNFCCIKKKETLGNMGQKLYDQCKQTKPTQQQQTKNKLTQKQTTTNQQQLQRTKNQLQQTKRQLQQTKKKLQQQPTKQQNKPQMAAKTQMPVDVLAFAPPIQGQKQKLNMFAASPAAVPAPAPVAAAPMQKQGQKQPASMFAAAPMQKQGQKQPVSMFAAAPVQKQGQKQPVSTFPAPAPAQQKSFLSSISSLF